MGGGGGGDTDPKISAQEQELAKVANEQADRWWQAGAPAQREWIKQGFVTDEDKSLMAGEINSAYGKQMTGAREQLKAGLNRQGVSPTSGNFTSAMTDFATTGGRGLSSAQGAGNLAMGNKHLGHLGNAAAVLRGDAAQAQDSMGTLANLATRESVSDAWGNLTKKNANQDMWGGIAGGLAAEGVDMYKNKNKDDE